MASLAKRTKTIRKARDSKLVEKRCKKVAKRAKKEAAKAGVVVIK